MQIDAKWHDSQVRAYVTSLPLQQRLAETLRQVLQAAARKLAPLAIVQARAKSVASFAEKAIRKQHKYSDPSRQLTDLAGARIVAHTRAEVDRFCRFIRENFYVDAPNSLDASRRLSTGEFGYRSIHYVVSFRPGMFPSRDVPVRIPPRIYGRKAEIQVRTILEHAWSDIGHDRIYKGELEVPPHFQRQSARVAAMLEQADASFSEIVGGIDQFRTSYGAYMTADEVRDEIQVLRRVHRFDRRNPVLAQRIGKMAMSIGEWELAVKVMRPLAHLDHVPLLRDLGIAMRKLDPRAGWRRGRKLLERAVALDPADIDAIASLAGAWRGVDEARAAALYRRAYELDPTNPYPLGCHLEHCIQTSLDVGLLAAIRPTVEAAIRRAHAQADVGVNLPWACYDIGKLQLLLGRTHEALIAYARAISLTESAEMLATNIASLERLKPAAKALPQIEWARRLLLLGAAVKFPSPATLRKLRRLARAPRVRRKGPVVIAVGAPDATVRALVKSSRAAMIQDRSTTRRSHLDVLARWTALISDRIRVTDIKLIGIGGDEVAGFEYRLALALGAQALIIRGTGGEAELLARDADWSDARGLLLSSYDVTTISAFVSPAVDRLDSRVRDRLARAIHREYQRARLRDATSSDPSMADWDQLLEHLKESNRMQADDIERKLRAIGCRIARPSSRPVVPMRFTRREIETMAELEHARWTIERLRGGWKLGKVRDVRRRISPHLVGWSRLSQDVRDWDRRTVAAIPGFLVELGMEVQRA